jgi:hypothetical protein
MGRLLFLAGQFEETNTALSGDEHCTFGRRTLHFRETNTALSGDEHCTFGRRICIETIENK